MLDGSVVMTLVKSLLPRKGYMLIKILRPRAIGIIQEKTSHLNKIRHDLERLTEDAEQLSQYKQRMRSLFPTLYTDLNRRAHAGNSRVNQSIELSNKEFEDQKAINPKASRFREEFRGTIPGLRLIAVNIRDEVISNLTAKADEIMSANLAPLPTGKLTEWEIWVNNFDASLENTRQLISDGTEFFTPECFHLLGLIATIQTEKTALSKLTVAALKNGSSAMVTTKKSAAAEPATLSKKDRDRQKKLEAMLRNL